MEARMGKTIATERVEDVIGDGETIETGVDVVDMTAAGHDTSPT